MSARWHVGAQAQHSSTLELAELEIRAEATNRDKPVPKYDEAAELFRSTLAKPTRV